MINYLQWDLAVTFLSTMWSIVLFGSVLKLFYTNRFELLSVSLYLVLGWMIVFVLKPLQASIPSCVLSWIIIGGLSYTVGVYFYINGYKKFYHFVWHIFVLLGSIAHTYAIWLSIK